MVVFRLAWNNFFRSRHRFFLASLGLMMVTTLSVSLLSLTHGLATQTRKSMENRQVDLYLLPTQTMLTPFVEQFGNSSVTLPADLAEKISQKRTVSAVCRVSPFTFYFKDRWFHFIGIEPDKFNVFYPSPFRLSRGSLIIPRSDTLMLGSQLAELFHLNVEYMLSLGNQDLKVSGILAKMGGAEDSQGFIPLEEAAAFTKKPGYSMLYVQLNNEASIPEVKKEITEEYPDVAVYTAKDYFAPTFHFLQRLKIIEWGIVAVVILVVFLMQNEIFLGAAEARSKEYAIFQAFGASRAFIFAWILLEGFITFLVSLFPGLIFGFLGGTALNDLLVELFHLSFPVAGFSFSLLAISTGIALFVTVIALVSPSVLMTNLKVFNELEKQLCD